MAQKLDNIRDWKGNVNKVLWVLFLSTLALIVDIIATHL